MRRTEHQEISCVEPTWFQYLNPTRTLPETFWNGDAYQQLLRIPDMKQAELLYSSRSPSTAAPPRLLSGGRGFTSVVHSTIPYRSLGSV